MAPMARGRAHLADEIQDEDSHCHRVGKVGRCKKMKGDQPRFVDAVHEELSEIVAGTLPAQDTNSIV